MKIGYLLEQDVDIRTPPFDGPANHVREVVQGFRRRGHGVTVLFRLENRLWITEDLEHFHLVTVPAMDRGPLRGLERGLRRLQYELQLPYAALFESLRFALACRRELAGCDLFFERMSWFDYGGALAARLSGIPLLYENNGDHLADLQAKGIAPHGVQRRLSTMLMSRAVQAASHVVVSGDGWRRAFLQRWNAPPHKVTTVENGTALIRLLSRAQLRSFQEAPGVQTLTLVYLGSFHPWQGVPNLLRALATVRHRGVQARLLLVGTGAGAAEARQMVSRLGIEGVVEFVGRLRAEAYAPLLAEADVGLAPYCNWPEFSGLKIFDYKAAGLATIASGRDGMPATLHHGHTGWIVPPCDEEALAEAICRLAADAPLRRRMGRAARLEAERCHGWEHTVAQLEKICRQAARPTRRRRPGAGQPAPVQRAEP